MAGKVEGRKPMKNELIPSQKQSALSVMAGKFSVEPIKLLDDRRATIPWRDEHDAETRRRVVVHAGILMKHPDMKYPAKPTRWAGPRHCRRLPRSAVTHPTGRSTSPMGSNRLGVALQHTHLQP
jgi:hypothetical protein